MRFSAAIHLLLIASGFAGLGYQIVWTRMLSIGLGHEVYAVLAVVAAFFAGLALGALVLDRRIAAARRPGHWYAWLEIGIGLWALALIWLMPLANGWIADWIGPAPSPWRHWAVAFAGPLLLLLPATLAMGATLPAAEAAFAQARDGRGIGGLYGANALGAMAGALATAFLIAPAVGFSATLILFALVNLACAAGMLLLAPRGGGTGAEDAPSLSPSHAPKGLMPALFLSGLLGVGYEVAVVRALAQIVENTIYSFAAALAVYLLGTALGAGAYQALYARRRGPGWDLAALAPLLGLTAVATALGTLAVFAVPAIYPALRLGAGGLVAEGAAALLTIGLPSAAMGALFSHLIQAAKGPRGGIGRALAANTAGGAIAPLAVGILLIPSLGVVAGLVVLSAVYAAGSLALLARPGARALPRAALALAGPAVLAALFAGPFDWRLVRPPAGGTVLAHVEGVAASASVVAEPGGHRHLRVNGTYTMGGTASYALDRIQGHLALLQHPAPRRALFLGVGTGATLASGARWPGLEVVGVDLSPEVLELIDAFPAVARDLSQSAGLRTGAADARRYVRAAEGSYDLILADNYHPAKDGAALLYTVEHYRAIRARLAPGGVAVQWLPLHQLDLAGLRLITRTFLEVFPGARLHMGNYNLVTPILALVARPGEGPPRLGDWVGRQMPDDLVAELRSIRFDSPFALAGGFLAGPEALTEFAGPGPLNTDDHPRLLFEAPETVYRALAPAAERLLTLVRDLPRLPRQAVDFGPEAGAFGIRLERYWQARDAFLTLGASVNVTGTVNHDARLLAPPLIEIVRHAPDFRPAYDPVLSMARRVAATEPQYAMNLLEGLDGAHPDRADARRLRAEIARVAGLSN